MPDFASALKEEIRRLARKEAKRCAVLVSRAVAKHRKEIAQLKRQVAQLLRGSLQFQAVGPMNGGRGGFTAAAAPGDGAAADGRRFSAKGLRSHRKRLNLSANQFGALIGVSAQSIYAWESGRARPRMKPLSALIALRAMSKTSVFERLAQLEAEGARGGDGDLAGESATA